MRRDLAEATFGTDVARHLYASQGGFFSPNRLVISVPEPQLLAVDRYSTMSVSKGNNSFTLQNDADGSVLENEMRGDLEKALDRVQPEAIRFTKSLVTAQLTELAGPEAGEVEVPFVADDSTRASQLADLIRLTQAQQNATSPRD